MECCKLIPKIYIKNGKLVENEKSLKEIQQSVTETCEKYENEGADEILIYELSEDDKEHDINIGTIKEIVSITDIPILLGGNVKRFEDVKKYLYAGAKMAVLDARKQSNVELISEVSERFGADKIAVRYDFDTTDDELCKAAIDCFDSGATLFITPNKISKVTAEKFSEININLMLTNSDSTIDDILEYGSATNLYGFSSEKIFENTSFMDIKHKLKEAGIDVNVFESKMDFSEFKLNSDDMIPVVVQDYKTNEVLMVAYMNEEAFNKTVETGVMTYFSRSRNELWVKGLTSGHFQYVKSLTIDCDNDTLLAKVKQIGAACHTGNRSCFFNELMKKEYDDKNPLMVFEDVLNVIKDRKINPKEGSYTNYLFDKGVDKILKKVGEEATEIVIAAKNPDPEEVKYEVSDFLYHVMVLMVEKGISWEDITKELARR